MDRTSTSTIITFVVNPRAEGIELRSLSGRIAHRRGAWRAEVSAHADGCVIGEAWERSAEPDADGHTAAGYASREEAEAYIWRAFDAFLQGGREAMPGWAAKDAATVEQLLRLNAIGRPYYEQADAARQEFLQQEPRR